MIRLRHGKVKFELVQSWAELTLAQWEKICEAKTNKEIVTSCTNKIGNFDITFTDEFIESVMPYLSWMIIPIDSSGWVMDQKYKIDIRKCEFNKIILLRNVNETKERVRKSIELFYDFKPDELTLYDALTISNDLYSQLSKINELEAVKLRHVPTSEQRRAGIEKFDQFGIMNVVDSLAGGDILKYEQVLKIDYNTVFMKMLRSKVESDFQRRYSKIMNGK